MSEVGGMSRKCTLPFVRKGNSKQAVVDVPSVGTIKVDIRKVRRLNAQPTSARNWEIALRRTKNKLLVCGTAGNEVEAEAAVVAALEKFVAGFQQRADRLLEMAHRANADLR